MSGKLELQQSLGAQQSQLNACVNEMAVLNAKIAKIQELIKEFTALKERLESHKKEIDNIADTEHEYWQGNLRDDYEGIVRDDLSKGALSKYIGNVDDNLDELNNELMRLQNEVYSTEGLIGGIKSAMNWISTKIENLTN